MTRAEYMKWSKDRALKLLEDGKPEQAWTSMVSDLNKHPETAGHIGIKMGINLLAANLMSTPAQIKKFIEDFA
jgi:hypothetical protein